MVATRQSWEKNNTNDQSIVTTAETAMLTLEGINASLGRSIFDLMGTVVITPAADTTSINVRIRRGTGVTGTTVNEAMAVAVTAATPTEVTIVRTDTLPNAAGQTYTLTVEPVAASANATVSAVSLRCDSRSG